MGKEEKSSSKIEHVFISKFLEPFNLSLQIEWLFNEFLEVSLYNLSFYYFVFLFSDVLISLDYPPVFKSFLFVFVELILSHFFKNVNKKTENIF